MKIVEFNGKYYREDNCNLYVLKDAHKVKVIETEGKNKSGEVVTYLNKVVRTNVQFVQVKGKDGVWRNVNAADIRTVTGCEVQLSDGKTTFVQGKPVDGIEYTNSKTGKKQFVAI